MLTIILRPLAFLAILVIFASSAQALGNAVITNQCPYPVQLEAVKGVVGFVSEIETLNPSSNYVHTWESIPAPGGGWSIKLRKPSTPAPSYNQSPSYTQGVLQFEYTMDTIAHRVWIDMSAVDGNPWAEDWAWETDDQNVELQHRMYRYDVDDANGMQLPLAPEASVTLELCGPSMKGKGKHLDRTAKGRRKDGSR